MTRVSLFLATVLTGAMATAQVPSLVGFQAHLTDVSGNAIDQVGVTVQVSLYHEAVGGDPFWVDEYEAVDVTQGVFSLLLGSGNNALPADQMTGGVKYLGISINGSPELSPKLQLVSVPYAIRANAADSAISAQTAASLDGFTADQFVKKTEIPDLAPDVSDLQQQVAQLQGQVTSLQDLLQNPGCVDDCATGSVGCSDDLGQAWTCGDGGDEDPCNEQLFTSCPGDQKCNAGTCSCLPNFDVACFGDDAYLVDSCGKQGPIKELCGEGKCNDGECIDWERQTPLKLPGMNELIVVGGSLYAVGDDGVVVHYDGLQWTHMATETDKNLRAIWGFLKTGDTVLFAVGENGKLLHYENGKWETVITGNYNTLNGIFGLSSTNIIAVGDNGTVLTFDGTSWTAEEWDDEATWTNDDFHAVWAHSSSKIWVGGEGGRNIHWDGTEWKDQSTPGGNDVRGMWGVSDQNVWAVTNGQIWRFKTTWENEFDAGVDLHDVWADVASEPGNVTVWAAGNGSNVFKRDALSWSQQPDVSNGFPNDAHFRGIMGGNGTGAISPAGGIWVVSSDGRFAYNDPDGKWIFPALTRSVTAFYGVAGDPLNQFAVGSDCLALQQDDGEWLEAPIDDGTCADGSGGSDFNAMWGDGTGATIFAVGENGMIKSWDGAAWLEDVTFTENSSHNNDIWGMDAANMFLVQSGATFIWNGVTWQNTGGGGGVSGTGSSMTDFWVVDGNGGAVKHFDGSEWTEQVLTSEAFTDIWSANASVLWAVGTNGTAFQYTGDWTDRSIPEDVLEPGGETLNAVFTLSPFDVYVASNAGHTYIRGSAPNDEWTHQSTFPATNHNIVYGADAQNVLLGGDGTIYLYNE